MRMATKSTWGRGENKTTQFYWTLLWSALIKQAHTHARNQTCNQSRANLSANYSLKQISIRMNRHPLIGWMMWKLTSEATTWDGLENIRVPACVYAQTSAHRCSQRKWGITDSLCMVKGVAHSTTGKMRGEDRVCWHRYLCIVIRRRARILIDRSVLVKSVNKALVVVSC